MTRIPESYKCSVCGKQKLEANHWFILNPSADVLGIYRWRSGMCNAQSVEHVCGQECAIKMFSLWLSSGKLQA